MPYSRYIYERIALETLVGASQRLLSARYRYLSRRRLAVKLWTQEKNPCKPSKFALPSTATSSFLLFSRA
jgi:hypothetical protein